MAKILAVEANRFSNKLIFDDATSLLLRKKDISAFQLAPGIEINKELLYERLCHVQASECYEAALNMLDRSAKTETEIRKKLQLKGYLNEVIDSACERLKAARLINDQYIAERVSGSLAASGKGRYVILQKLKARGIGKEETDAVLDGLSEEDQRQSAYAQAVKLNKKYVELDSRLQKQKLSQALARRGFSWDSIEYAMDRLEEE